ncbi:hypothetical protein FMUND_14549 [Fusarium mundagurra]|uniref:Uncharacterized protein n=1 Tax=Fusarium mundagurra TaxID=1567541 RepID=A0A8H5XV68_9HYPO|nr:hypothetical protein FMUND_14549 [Fusarium mundagurra]
MTEIFLSSTKLESCFKNVKTMTLGLNPKAKRERLAPLASIMRGARFQAAAISDHFLILLELLPGLNKSLMTRGTGSLETIDLGDSLLHVSTVRWAEMTAWFAIIYSRGGRHDIRFDDAAH